MTRRQPIDVIDTLSAEMREKIRRHQESGFVRLAPVLKDLGIHCRLAEMGPEVSGESYYAEGLSTSGFCIAVNSGHSVERQRFSAAHEIGHCLLHAVHVKAQSENGLLFGATNRSTMDRRDVGFGFFEVDPFSEMDFGEARRREREANQFAAHLLMPARLINKAARGGWRTLPDMAKKLWVSEGALERRLEELSKGSS